MNQRHLIQINPPSMFISFIETDSKSPHPKLSKTFYLRLIRLSLFFSSWSFSWNIEQCCLALSFSLSSSCFTILEPFEPISKLSHFPIKSIRTDPKFNSFKEKHNSPSHKLDHSQFHNNNSKNLCNPSQHHANFRYFRWLEQKVVVPSL